MIDQGKGLDLESKDSEYHHDLTSPRETTPSQTLNLKHVEIKKVSDKPTYDTSLERS